jgi:hypothetical protein
MSENFVRMEPAPPSHSLFSTFDHPLIADGDETPDPVEHWCFTRYLIDGHHKLHSASEAGKSFAS